MRYLFVPALTMSALAYLAPTPSHSAALDDPTIVAIFDAANTYDIETGQLALQKSRPKAVRDLAQQFVSDHTALRQQGRQLAKKLSVTPTPPKQLDLATAHAKAMKEQRSKSGTEFDRAYADQEVQYHQRVALGTITLTAIAPDNDALQRSLAFSPIYLTDGIQLSDDPFPALRAAVYALSVQHRGQGPTKTN